MQKWLKNRGTAVQCNHLPKQKLLDFTVVLAPPPKVVSSYEFSKETKTFAMPPEWGTGFEDQKCVFPVLNVTGDQDEPEALGASEAWFF